MMTSYWPAILISLLLHCGVIFLVAKVWGESPQQRVIKPPAYVKATLIDLKTRGEQGAKKSKPKPEPKKVDLQKKRREQERLQALAKQRAEKQAQQQALKKRLAREQAEKDRQEALVRERALEKRQREQALMELARLEQQQLQDSLKDEREQLEAEQKAQAIAQQTEDDQLLSQSWSAFIQKKVQQNWSRPPSARNNMETLLTIRLIPTGEIIDVSVARSSGNEAFDRSAVQAVKRVGQFAGMNAMPPRIFERDFRQFTLMFTPQDLRQ